MRQKQDFKHKVVVITGAAGGIGRALAARFAKARARLVLIDLDEGLLSALVNQVSRNGVEAMYYVCDITQESRITSVMHAVIQHYGGIDVLINNAGITHRSAFVDTASVVFRNVMEVNYMGALYCTRAALTSIIARRGQVITMSSTAGFSPQALRSGYAASKYALHGLFESLRVELLDTGVHVMMVCPGFTATDMNKKALMGDGSISTQPFSLLGDIASPETVADHIFDGAVRKKNLLIMSNVTVFQRIIATLFPAYFAKQAAQNPAIRAVDS
jgi:short-subunit dehydrogenase